MSAWRACLCEKHWPWWTAHSEVDSCVRLVPQWSVDAMEMLDDFDWWCEEMEMASLGIEDWMLLRLPQLPLTPETYDSNQQCGLPGD